MTKYGNDALDELARTIHEAQRDVDYIGAERDRLLAKASELAQAKSDAMTRAVHLREILAGADAKYYATVFGEPFDAEADPTRDELIAGHRDILAFVEATPEVPFNDGGIYISTDALRGATNQERRAEADRLAALLGVEITSYTNYRGRQQLIVRRDFGRALMSASIELDLEPEPQPEQPETGEQAYVDEAVAEASGEALDEGMTGMTGMGEATAEPTREDLIDAAAEQDQADDDAYETYLAEHPFGDDEVPEGQCGAKAVNPDGETGRCTLDAGHDDPDSPAYNCQQTDGHFDRSFGFWCQAGERTFLGRGKHAPSLVDDTRCAKCGLAVGVGYCFGPSRDAAAVSAGAR